MLHMSPVQARVLLGVKRGRRCDAMTDAYNRNGKKDGGRLYRHYFSIYKILYKEKYVHVIIKRLFNALKNYFCDL